MVIPIRIFEIERSNTSEVLFKMTEKMTYEQMVAKACESAGGKFMSRAQIKSFLTANFGYVNSAMAKNALKKALTKFERKGDSFRVSKEAAKVKAAAQKAKIAEKKAAAKAKLSAKKALAKEKAAQKKEKLAAKKAALKEKLAAKKAKLAAKKQNIAEKKAAKKAKALPKKKTAKKAKALPKKKVAKKPVKKTVKKTVAKKA